jgi:hypothetical protein
MGRFSAIPFYAVISLKVFGGKHRKQREYRMLQ